MEILSSTCTNLETSHTLLRVPVPRAAAHDGSAASCRFQHGSARLVRLDRGCNELRTLTPPQKVRTAARQLSHIGNDNEIAREDGLIACLGLFHGLVAQDNVDAGG